MEVIGALRGGGIGTFAPIYNEEGNQSTPTTLFV